MTDTKVIVDCSDGTETIEPLDAGEQQQLADDLAGAEALAWETLRVQRDSRLTDCDWTQLPDAGLEQVAVDAWAAYRQELRDLPENTADPYNPDWPEPPPTPSEIVG